MGYNCRNNEDSGTKDDLNSGGLVLVFSAEISSMFPRDCSCDIW